MGNTIQNDTIQHGSQGSIDANKISPDIIMKQSDIIQEDDREHDLANTHGTFNQAVPKTPIGVMQDRNPSGSSKGLDEASRLQQNRMKVNINNLDIEEGE